MSNPSLPPAPAQVAPPPLESASSSPPPLLRRRRRARDPDDDDDALEEGELRVPILGGQHESSDSDTEDDDDVDGRRRYLVQPHAEYDDYNYNPEAVRRRQHYSPRLRRSLDALDALLLGAGAGAGGALPSPTTPSGDCESDATLSDDSHHHDIRGGGNSSGSTSSSAAGASSAATDVAGAVDRGWAVTGKRGWKAGGNKNKNTKQPAAAAAAVVLAPTTPVVSDLSTVSAAGNIQAAGTTSINPHGTAAAAALHHQPPVPKQEEAHQPPRAPALQPSPLRRRARQRLTEYTCQVCGKTYPTNQALGGHAAGHKNKQREAEAMAAAMAAAGGEGASLAAAAFPPLGRGGGKVHECRMCGKVFATGVALGGHMRVHYTGPPIATRKNKKRCLAPLPTAEGGIAFAAAAPPVALSLALSIKAEDNIAVAATTPVVAATAAGLALGLSFKAEEESPSTPPPSAVPPAGGDGRVVRLFGMNISPQMQPQSPLQQQQQGSGDTTEDSSSTGEEQQH